MAAEPCAIGLDLGGTGIYGVVVDRNGQVLAAAEERTPAAAGPEAVLQCMEGVARGLVARAGRPVLGVGLGIPGLLDRAAGVSVFSPNLHWRNVTVRERFATALGLPVNLDNDVRCAGLGELHFGAGRGVSDFVLLTVGTGIGGCIVLDGQVYRGPDGLAGEIGHMPLQPGGPLCNCGNRGCLEAIASGSAIARRAQAEGLPYGTARAVAVAAAAGEPGALRLMAAVGRDLGIGLATYVNLMNPRRIILGGGVALAGEVLLAPTRAAAREYAMAPHKESFAIVAAELGDGAGAIGAATLVPGFRQGGAG